jgi:SPP1 gp7 family putative phage head morphogenesis protein
MIRLFRQVAPRPRQKRLPRQLHPTTIALRYYDAIHARAVAPAADLVRARLLPELPSLLARHDDVRHDVRASEILGKIAREIADKLNPSELGSFVKRYGAETSKFQREQLHRQLRAGLGINVVAADPDLNAVLERFAAENVALIRSLPTRYLDDVETRVARAVRTGARAEDVAAELEARLGVAEDRARLIARDQIGKLNGELNKTRQEALGVDAFVWRTSRDERVRPAHAAREGKSFMWTEPPADGIPGEAVNCRCFAEPSLTALLASL